MDSGPQPITDSAELDHVRRQARRVHRNALTLALALTAALVLVSLSLVR
jgi:hypothetical protein